MSTIASTDMRYKILSLIVAFWSLSFGVCASDSLPEVLKNAPITGLPISVGKSSYDHIFVESSEYVSDGDTAEHEQHYDVVARLSKNILSDDRKHILSINGDEWDQAKQEMIAAKRWWITVLPCPGISVQCFLLGGNGVINLVVITSNQVTDFQLVNAQRYEEKGGGTYGTRIAGLDTTFGDGTDLQKQPITNFEKTGIFCTEYIAGKHDEEFRLFKRRITPEGKIENKEVQGTYEDCKAPW